MSNTTIHTFAKWKVKKGEIHKVLKLITELSEKSSKEEGNLIYKVFQSNTHPDVLMLFESYKGEASIEAHRASGHFQEIVLKKIVPLLENREVIQASELEF